MTVATDDDPTAALTRLLAAPPRPPRDPDLFSTSTQFGAPGIYPEGTAMVPASGPAIGTADAIAAVALGLLDDEAGPR